MQMARERTLDGAILDIGRPCFPICAIVAAHSVHLPDRLGGSGSSD
jgi:hypothetical protein